jgi:mannose-6-phosphate isomerase
VFGRPLAPDAWAEGLERALDIATSEARPRPEAGIEVVSGPLRRMVGCRGDRFVLERWGFAGPVAARPGEGGFVTLTNLGDEVEVEHPGGVVTVARAASCLLPAALGEVRLSPDGAGDLVVCFEPGDGRGAP